MVTPQNTAELLVHANITYIYIYICICIHILSKVMYSATGTLSPFNSLKDIQLRIKFKSLLPIIHNKIT